MQLLGARLQRANGELCVSQISSGLNVLHGNCDTVSDLRDFLAVILQDLASENATQSTSNRLRDIAGEVTLQNQSGRFVVRRSAGSAPDASRTALPTGLPDVRRRMGETPRQGLGRIFTGDAEGEIEAILSAHEGFEFDDSHKSAHRIKELQLELAAVRRELAVLNQSEIPLARLVHTASHRAQPTERIGHWQQRLREIAAELKGIEANSHRAASINLEADVPLYHEPFTTTPEIRRVDAQWLALMNFVQRADVAGECPHCQWERLQLQIVSQLEVLRQETSEVHRAWNEERSLRERDAQVARHVSNCADQLRELHDDLGAHWDDSSYSGASNHFSSERLVSESAAARWVRPAGCHHQPELHANSFRRQQLLDRERWLMDEIDGQRRAPRQSKLLRHVETLAAKLSGGRIVGLQRISPGRMVATNSAGERADLRSLSLPDAAAVRLALTLAIAHQAARAGHRFPLLLSDAQSGLQQLDSGRVADVLTSLGGSGLQILVCTADHRWAHNLSALGAKVQELSPITRQTWSAPTEISVPSNSAAPAFGPGWDGEEFPGELSDRSRTASRLDGSHANRRSGRIIATPTSELTSSQREFAREPVSDESAGASREVRRSNRTDAPHGREPNRTRRRRRIRRATEDGAPRDSSTGRARKSRAGRVSRRLEAFHPLADAPSIGPCMAIRFSQAGIHTVGDFLNANVQELVGRLKLRRLSEGTLREWQQQALLAVKVPDLRGRETQLLVACGIDSPESLARKSAGDLFGQITAKLRTAQGTRIWQQRPAPTTQDVAQWIAWAASARSSDAA